MLCQSIYIISLWVYCMNPPGKDVEDPAGVELAGWTEGRVGRQTTQTRQLVDAQVGQQRGPNHTHNNWARLAVEERADMWAPIFSRFATTRLRDFNTKFLLLKLYETFRCTGQGQLFINIGQG